MASRDIETIIGALTKKHPQLRVEQLQVKHPGADDDGIWFFNHPDSEFDVQLESSFGTFPFVVETDRHDERGQATTVQEATQLVEDWLGLPAVG
ncbi:MAG: hypothetical protein KY475_19965 [Planctomycetes bacterium]|nr:hypothetical protein [Planctomycetota bacterium]